MLSRGNKNTLKSDTSALLPRRKGYGYALPLFVIVGVVLTLSVFLVLKSFVNDTIKDEHNRMMQGLVESVMGDVQSFHNTMESLANIVAVSRGQTAGDVINVLKKNVITQQNFSHIFWFYKKPDGRWSFSDLTKNISRISQSSGVNFTPDAEILATLLRSAEVHSNNTFLLYDLEGLSVRNERTVPRIESGAFALINVIDDSRGFLLGVVDPSLIYNEGWIKSNRFVQNLTIRDLKDNRLIFNFDRNGATVGQDLNAPQVYEFPVVDRQWELRGEFTRNAQTKFLELFPYIFVGMGFFLVGVGALYLLYADKQAKAFSRLNEVLGQKNFELKAEIAERERLNKALRDAEAENRSVIDSIGDVIFEIGRESQFVFLNQAWEKVTGFEVEQSLGQELFQMTHPNDQTEQRHEFRSLLKGQKQEMRSYTRLRSSDGTFIAVELTLSVIQNDNRKGMRFIGTITDIEERRRVERALSEAEKKYRNIVENAAGGIYQITPEGLFLSANPSFARILGYDSPEAVLREVKNANETVFIDLYKRQNFYRELEKYEVVRNHETQMRCRDGSAVWVNENARAVKDDNGQVLYIEGSIEDITQRKESDSAIREAKVHSDLANRAKSEFLANMSHELRTPLNSIIGFSEMIHKEIFGAIEQASYKEYAEEIYKSGHSLLKVINEILDISKIEAGERQLNETEVSLKELTDSVMEMMSSKIDSAQLHISFNFEHSSKVLGEELALKQVILNLLSNAVKYTPEGGRITISSHIGKRGRMHYAITDTGVGLNDAEIKKALSPFGQVNSELSRSGSGTGLGLTLVDALVKLHGGDFELFSQKGIGTTATMILPASRVIKDKQKSPELTR